MMQLQSTTVLAVKSCFSQDEICYKIETQFSNGFYV